MTTRTTPASTVCLDALIGDLVLRTLLHDLRGGLGVIQGWIEVAALDGHLNSPQLDDSIAALGDTLVGASENLSSLAQFPLVSGETLLRDIPGARLPTVGFRAYVCAERFREAMMLAVPVSVTLLSPTASDRVILEVSGLTTEGVSQACRPTIARLVELRQSRSDDRTLGAILLRAVAGATGGHVRASGPDKIEMHFRGEVD